MAEQILLAPPDAGQPVHPGQKTGILERLDRDVDRVAAAFGGRRDLLVPREAAPGAIGPVKPP